MQKINCLGKNGTKKLKEYMINYVETNRCNVITADDINQWFDEIFYTEYIKIPKGTSLSVRNGTYGFSLNSEVPYTPNIKISAVVYNNTLLRPNSNIEYGQDGNNHYKNSYNITGVELFNNSGFLSVCIAIDNDNFTSDEDASTTQIGLYHDLFLFYTTAEEPDLQIYTYSLQVSENKLQTQDQYGFELPYGFSYPEPYTVLSVTDENGCKDYECSQHTTILDGKEIVYLLILSKNPGCTPTHFFIKLKHTKS